MLDIRAFTPFANAVEPRLVLEVLTIHHALIVPIVQKHHGVVDKFLGDGVMATFGAVAPSATSDVDAMRALEDVVLALGEWHARLAGLGCPRLPINGAVASGRIVFAAIGNAERLEYTVIGEPANLAAKLEKHNKTERTIALAPRGTYERALAQGFRPRLTIGRLEAREVPGYPGTVDLISFKNG